MNLGRSKLILIFAFVGLNLFLGYHLFWPDFGRLTRVAVTMDEIHSVELMLNDNNYYLETSIDRSARSSDFLTVSPAQGLQEKILQDFIKKGAQVVVAENATVYRTEEETAVVYSTGLIRIIYEPGVFLAENTRALEEQQLTELVETYLVGEGLMPQEIVFDYLVKRDVGFITLHYYQVYEETPVYSGKLQVTVDSDKLTAVEIYWLEPVERFPNREIEVISAADALKNLMAEIGSSPEPKTVKEIKLGYFGGEYDAEKWEIQPVWRIVLDNYEYYYINAFTGNIEQDIVIPEQAL